GREKEEVRLYGNINEQRFISRSQGCSCTGTVERQNLRWPVEGRKRRDPKRSGKGDREHACNHRHCVSRRCCTSGPHGQESADRLGGNARAATCSGTAHLRPPRRRTHQRTC